MDDLDYLNDDEKDCIYTCDDSNPYYSRYTAHLVEDGLEDVGEDFLTQEEFLELDAYSMMIHDLPLIKKDLTKALKSIPENKKSTIMPSDLGDVVDHWAVKYKIQSWLEKKKARIVGDRLYNAPVTQTRIRKTDYESIRRRVHSILDHLVMFNGDKRPDSIRLMKKIVTWEQVVKKGDYSYDQKINDTKWLKKIWDNPELAK